MPRRTPALPVVVVALIAATVAAGAAAKPPQPGSACTQQNFSTTFGNRTWTCARRGHKSVWVVGAARHPGPGGGSSSPGSGAAGGSDLGAAAAAQVVTASPYDLVQIRAVSKFRSCSGHDYSGLDIQGQRETNRSMKHYFVPTLAALQSPGLMNVYAPFAGTVAQIQSEEVPIGKQLWIDSADGRWQVRIFHTDPVVTQGQKVAAGALLGHPAFASDAYGNPNAFVSDDIPLVYTGANLGGEVFDSLFAHMTPAVAAQWAAHGVTTVTAIVPRATRDATPCTGWANFGADDYVTLTP